MLHHKKAEGIRSLGYDINGTKKQYFALLCSFFVLLCANHRIMCCYMQVWANNADDNNRRAPSHFSDSQLECCELKRDVIRGS